MWARVSFKTEQLQQSFNGSVKPARRATYKQRRLLNALGVDISDPDQLSVAEASKLIEEAKVANGRAN